MSASTAGVTSDVAPPRRVMRWTGCILTAIPVLLMVFSASMKFSGSPQMMDEFVHRFGYPASTALILGIVEITCVILYAVPRTAVIGAILLTGYLGGAVATHVRIGDPAFLAPFGLGIIAWAGLYLRDDRLRVLLPLRRPTALSGRQ